MQKRIYTRTVPTPTGEFYNSVAWGQFITITTKYTLTLKAARSLATKVHTHLNKNGVIATLLWVAEKFDAKDGEHIHALVLVEGIKPIDQKRYINRAIDLAVGKSLVNQKYTTIYPYDKDKGAHEYITKQQYRKNSDWDIFLPTTTNY